MIKRSFVKRVVFYILGLFVLALGIALAPKANLGVASVSTISFAGSMIVPLTFGMCTTIFQIFCVLLQLALKRRMTVSLVLQLPTAYVFGFLIDFFSNLLRFPPPNIVYGIPLVVGSVLIFALGLRILFGASLILMPPDGLVRTISEISGRSLSKTKLVFDLTIVSISAAWTFVILNNALATIGIGTIITMLLAGPAIGMYQKLFPFFDVT